MQAHCKPRADHLHGAFLIQFENGILSQQFVKITIFRRFPVPTIWRMLSGIIRDKISTKSRIYAVFVPFCPLYLDTQSETFGQIVETFGV